MHNFWLLTSAVFIFFASSSPVFSERPVRIVGSTAVFGFSTMTAERMGKTTSFRTPIVEATGTGGGIKIFCSGKGKQHPDIVFTSRPMTKTEQKICKKNSVGEILELPIGYDGIVIGSHSNAAPFPLSLENLSKALSEQVDNKANPYRTWNQIDGNLPNIPILVLGPTSTLATREVFEDKVIKQGCEKYSPNKTACHGTIREDGAFIEVAEHESLIIQKLSLKPQALAFVSYGYYIQNPGKLKPLAIDGVLPTPQTISTGQYPLARMLYMYVKKKNLKKNPALKAYGNEFYSDEAQNEDGYLLEKGLIPLTEDELKKVRQTIR